MMYMNEWDIEEALRAALQGDTPNLLHATTTLVKLYNWTNRNSDGWPYWPKPVRAAKSLMVLIQSVDRYRPEDLDPAAVKRAYTPIKAFLTRHGSGHAEVFPVFELVDTPANQAAWKAAMG